MIPQGHSLISFLTRKTRPPLVLAVDGFEGFASISYHISAGMAHRSLEDKILKYDLSKDDNDDAGPRNGSDADTAR